MTSLRWFGSWRKRVWAVGTVREAVGAHGRYQIRRDAAEGFAVKHCPPYLTPDAMWTPVGTATTEAEAVALAETHNKAKEA